MRAKLPFTRGGGEPAACLAGRYADVSAQRLGAFGSRSSELVTGVPPLPP